MNDLMLTRRPLSRFALPLEQWFNEFFAGNGGLPSLLETKNLPRADVAETDKDFIVSIELPGMEENDVQVRVAGTQLVVAGERKQKKEDKDKHYYRMETTYGAFERRFELPDDVRKDPEGIKATVHKGILEVRLAKAEPRPSVKVPVKSL